MLQEFGKVSWQPKLRQVKIYPKPDYVPTEIYNEAMAALHHYNEQWEFWVFLEAQKANCSQAIAEDACIRGIRKELNKIKFVYGDKVGAWYEQFLDMGDLFNKVQHPIYIKKLDGT